MSLTQVTVTGTYRAGDGTAASGTVEFRPFAPMANAGSNVIVSPKVTATLVAGALSVTLYATDDSDTSPDGAVYQITERLTGSPERSYMVEIPNSGNVDLSDLSPATDMPYVGYATSAALLAAIDEARRFGAITTESTTARTLALTDAGDYIRCTNASATTVTVPPNGSVPFTVGTVVTLRAVGAAGIVVAAGVGVTVNTPAGASLVFDQGVTVSLVKVATNEWDCVGP